MTATTRTPLAYYGGKVLLAERIVERLPPHHVYLEPFAGGAAVLFAKPRVERETLNDLDGTIVRFWRVLRDRPDELAAAVYATPYSRDEWALSQEVDVDDDVEAARRLLVSVDQSFSRSRMSWSPPSLASGYYGRGRWQPGTWSALPEKITDAAERLRGVCLEHRDAVDLIPKFDVPGAAIYVDPPYSGPLRLAPEKGYRHDADAELWNRLAGALLDLDHAAVVLSGYACDATQRLEAEGWSTTPLQSRKRVQSRSRQDLPLAPERLWLNERALWSQMTFA